MSNEVKLKLGNRWIDIYSSILENTRDDVIHSLTGQREINDAEGESTFMFNPKENYGKVQLTRIHPFLKNRNCSYFGKKKSPTIITLTAIVIMYIICNIPRLMVNIFEHLHQEDINLDRCGCKKEPKWLHILCSISQLLLTFNSSANFLIYFSTENNFKRVFCNLTKKLRRAKSERLYLISKVRQISVIQDIWDMYFVLFFFGNKKVCKWRTGN